MTYRIITELPAKSNLLGTQEFNKIMANLYHDNGIDGHFNIIKKDDAYQLVFEKDIKECQWLIEIRVNNGSTLRDSLVQQLICEISVFEPDFKVVGIVNDIIKNLKAGQLAIEVESPEEFINFGDRELFPLFSENEASDGLRP